MSHGTKEGLSALGFWCRVLCTALLASGCCTAKALQIGQRHEWPRRFSGAFRDGDHLMIPLVAEVPESHYQRVPHEVPGWAAADLGTVAWGPVRQPNAIPAGALQSLALHDGPAPETPVPPYEVIPVVPLPPAAQRNDETMRLELREAIGSHSLSAEAVGGAGLLLLARPDPQAPHGLSMAAIHVEEREYRTWWAIPARAVAVPLMIPVDAIAMPVLYVHILIYGVH